MTTFMNIFGQAVTQGPGTGSFTEHLLEIVLMLVAAFLIGLWIGRLLISRYKAQHQQLQSEIDALKAEALGHDDKKLEIETLHEKINLLESKNSQLRLASKTVPTSTRNVNALEDQISSQKLEIARLTAELEACKKDRATFASKPVVVEQVESTKKSEKTKSKGKSSKTKVAKALKDNDLTKIEGIGPKIQGLLNEDKIYTFQDMIDAGIPRIQAILDKAGPLYKVHNPGTWTSQASLAAQGKWDELYLLQAELKGGKKV